MDRTDQNVPNCTEWYGPPRYTTGARLSVTVGTGAITWGLRTDRSKLYGLTNVPRSSVPVHLCTTGNSPSVYGQSYDQ